MIAIVVSGADEASEHVGEHLLEAREWDRRGDDGRPPAEGGGEYHVAGEFEMRTFEALHLHLSKAADAFSTDPDLLVFASRHSGETGPLLTAHFTGNLGAAEYGGEDGRLAEAAPRALSALVAAFEDHAPEGYDVGIECTHHGPSEVGCPSLFAEVGSAEAQWRDPEAARAVARSILELEGLDPGRSRERDDPPTARTVVGIGGGHYAPRFTRILRETPWSVGHVASDWALEELADMADGVDSETGRRVVRQSFDRSGAKRALLDGDHPDVAAVIEDLGYEVVGETWLRTVGDRSLDLVETVERELGTPAEGVRFGDRQDHGGIEVVELPTDLVAEAEGIDPDAVRETVRENVVAYRTREGASRTGDAVVVPATERDGSYDAIVDGLAGILTRKYRSVSREDDAVVAEERAFDPQLAREAGVSEGPAYGKLSSGQSVTVDGERVDPEDVHRERTHRFPV